LKIILSPALIALASLAGRRWGLKVSGLFAAFPIVAGPILLLFALEQGPAFAAQASQGTLAGVVGFNIFAVVYGRVSRKGNIAASILAGWAAFFLVNAGLGYLRMPVYSALTAALASVYFGFKLLPPGAPAAEREAGASVWDLPLRMVFAVLLVLGLTTAAKFLGPELSGVLAPFPTATTVLVAFAHYHQGPDGVLRLLTGAITGMIGFSFFCAAVSLGLAPWGTAPAFTIGVVACLAVNWVVIRLRWSGR